MKRNRILVTLLAGMILAAAGVVVMQLSRGSGGDIQKVHAASPTTCAKCHPAALVRTCSTCHAAPPRTLVVQPENISLPFPHHDPAPGGPIDNCTLAFCHGGTANDVRFEKVSPGNLRQYCYQCHPSPPHSVTTVPYVDISKTPPANNCLFCHALAGFTPAVPASHAGRTNNMCTFCHQPVVRPTPAPTATPTPAATATPTPTPAATATPTPTPAATATPTPTPVATATATPTPAATATPAPTLAATATPTPTPAAATPTPTPTPAPGINAQALYTANNCGLCHGANRQGGFGPAITSAALAGKTQTEVAATITNGKGLMPAFSGAMTPAQIDALAQWLKATP